MNRESIGDQDLLQKIVSLCKRRGFVFQSSEIYGGLKSAYDFGPLGVELKRNIANLWWREIVTKREDVVGIDASIMMAPQVWQASGHLSAGFADPLVDCLNCKERFRADKAPQKPAGAEVAYLKGGKKDGDKIVSKVKERGYVCPNCGSPELSEERKFNLMFRTSIGPVDPLEDFINQVAGKNLDRVLLREKLEESINRSAIYLRPETAQAMFVQFNNVVQSMSMRIPFGIAQQGRSFRNEITTERFIFRSCEFEQMELEYFVEPGTQADWFEYWKQHRFSWWSKLLNNPDRLRIREHSQDELAHYAEACVDIEYNFPWGWGELEGIASRTDYDLKRHSEASGVKLSYFDQTKTNPETGKQGIHFVPYVIEPAAGLSRAVLVMLFDAYSEEEGVTAEGEKKNRVFLKLKPQLAPIKVAVLPLMKKDDMPRMAREIVDDFYYAGISARYDEQHSIGKRYSRHDEIGTPFCLTVDPQSLQDRTVTIRDRDTTEQDRIPAMKALEFIKERLKLD